LINAFRGEPTLREKCLQIIGNPARVFHYSPFLELEVTIQATHHHQTLEMEFYREYFANATCYGDLNRLFEIAREEVSRHGIPILDAMHIACANLTRCEVLVTTEKRTKPIFRTQLTRVVTASSLDA
jgi:hypothetical protein